MGTSTIPLAMTGAILPDGSGSGNNPPQPVRLVSTGSQPSNTPKLTQLAWAFDSATDECLMWVFILPPNFNGGGTVRLKFRMAAINSGNVVWKGSIRGARDVTNGSPEDDSAAIFDNGVVTAIAAAPGVIGQVEEAQLAVGWTNNVLKHVVFIGRDADDSNDTAAGDALLLAASYEYDSF